jgi:hypothetical protein
MMKKVAFYLEKKFPTNGGGGGPAGGRGNKNYEKAPNHTTDIKFLNKISLSQHFPKWASRKPSLFKSQILVITVESLVIKKVCCCSAIT